MPRRAAPPPPTPTPSSSYKEWLESAEHCQWCGSDDWQPGPPSKRTLIYCTSCAVACTHIECSEQYDVYAMTVEKAASGEEDWFCSEVTLITLYLFVSFHLNHCLNALHYSPKQECEQVRWLVGLHGGHHHHHHHTSGLPQAVCLAKQAHPIAIRSRLHF